MSELWCSDRLSRFSQRRLLDVSSYSQRCRTTSVDIQISRSLNAPSTTRPPYAGDHVHHRLVSVTLSDVGREVDICVQVLVVRQIADLIAKRAEWRWFQKPARLTSLSFITFFASSSSYDQPLKQCVPVAFIARRDDAIYSNRLHGQHITYAASCS